MTRQESALPAACLAISVVIETLFPDSPGIGVKNPVLEVWPHSILVVSISPYDE